MSVRLNAGHGVHADAIAIEDFENMSTGISTTIPQLNGNNGMVLFEGHTVTRRP